MSAGIVFIKKPKINLRVPQTPFYALKSRIECLSKSKSFLPTTSQTFQRLYKSLEASKEIHERSIDIIQQKMRNVNVMFTDDEQQIKEQLCQPGGSSIPFVVSLGGDGHFLSTSKYIQDKNIPIVGINTDPERSGGFLCGYKIYSKQDAQETEILNKPIDHLVSCLEDISNAKFSYRTRTRIDVKRLPYETEDAVEKLKVVDSCLSLNEMVMEESFGAKTCTYELTTDEQNLGILKSSGLIVSTGSGSTGLLLSARRPRISELCGTNEIISNNKSQCATVHSLRNIHESLQFSSEEKKFYYLNRELCRNPFDLKIYESATLMSLSQQEEGFCSEKLQVTNLNMDGNILVDGNKVIKLEYGDQVEVSIGTPLKCIV
ncbi:unnamed protein product [Moneuplotes crassus]|uniref:NAD(+) kinase n=1 Tax=Euplotes crassus TaxID=5936 RepID=A0AAD1UKF0_EUPCR|nr:unnamed protein product [Moneuplotes crassus]